MINYGDIESLKMYHIHYLFHYLMANNYLERIAIDNKFNIDEINAFSFEEIEEIFNVKFINNIQPLVYNYIAGAIQELANYITDDKYILSYVSMFEIGRVKTLLPYIDKEGIDKIKEMYNNNKYSYDKNSALRKIKKLIGNRKEEFSE